MVCGLRGVGTKAAVRSALLACACVLAAFVLVGAARTAFAATPAAASATEPAIEASAIAAQVQTDGSLHVSEVRTLAVGEPRPSFETTWLFDELPAKAEVKVVGARLAPVNAEGEVADDWLTLDAVPFSAAWREGDGPSQPAWAFDELSETLHVYAGASEGRVAVGVDYVVENAAVAYADVADLQWMYVPVVEGAPTANVDVLLSLPVPQGEAVVPGENVRAWGHGPADGSVTVGEDGTIAWSVPQLVAGQYAEARVVFPTGWLTNLEGAAARANLTKSRLADVVEAEDAWMDDDAAWRRLGLSSTLLAAVACAALLAWGLVLYLRFGKEHEPSFTGTYWKDVPEEGLSPAVVGRLWRWNRESSDDFTATVMQLAAEGAVQVEFAGEPVGAPDCRITLVPEAADGVADPLGRCALDVLFGVVADGRGDVRASDIVRFAEEHPQRYDDAMFAFNRALSDAVAACGFFEHRGKRLQPVAFAVAAAVFVLGLAAAWTMGNVWVAAFAVPTAAALAVLANYLPRRSPHGNDVAAKCKALRNWMRDDETAADYAAQGETAQAAFLPYACVFGVADRVPASQAACALLARLSEAARLTRKELSSVESTFDEKE